MSTLKTDKQYQKEYDAQTLAEAEKIKSDKVRYAGAKQAAKTMVNEKKKETAALTKVAGTDKTTRTSRTSKTTKRK